jgi:MFS family permease
MFDVYLPVVALAPASAYFQDSAVSASTASVLSAMIFVATLVGRPVGAALFGHWADRIGRRRTAIVSVSGFTIVTFLIALLPGYHQIGITSVILMIALRFIDGVFLGGEYTAATPLALEYSPHRKRGLNGALIMSGFPFGYCLISPITLLVSQFAPAAGLDSPYVQWGWRIPFVLGSFLAAFFVGYYARNVSESEVWEGSERSPAPLRDLLRGGNLRIFGQVFLMMTGIWLTMFMVASVLPTLLKSTVKLGDSAVTTAALLGSLFAAGSYLLAGVASQRFGRRSVLVGCGLLTATVGTAAYGIVLGSRAKEYALVLVLVIVAYVVILACWGVVTTYVNERFHTRVRASGFGLGYTFAVIIPSFYAFYQAGLSKTMPSADTALVLLFLGAVLTVLGSALGPESRDVDMKAG